MASSGKWIEGIGPETTVADAARRSLEARLAVVAHSLPLAAYLASHDIEHVHRLRVATRRAAAALKLYRDWLPPKQARWMKERLRAIRRAAGEARDLDVLVHRLHRAQSSHHEPLVKFLAAKRVAVQPDIVNLADKLRRDDRFSRKAARLLEKIETVDAKEEVGAASPLRLSDWAPQQLAKFHSDFVELLPDESADIDALHQFRIRGKALRYAIELLAPAFDEKLRKEIYPAVEELQERLGHITDHIAAIRLFAEWESHQAGLTAEPRADDLDREKAQQVADMHEFHEWWNAERADWLARSLASVSVTATAESEHASN